MPYQRGRRAFRGAFVVILAALACGAQPAFAATINVDTTVDELVNTDNNNCALREAIESAKDDASYDDCEQGSGADVINLQAATYNLTNGLLNPSDQPVTLAGISEASTVIDGAGLQFSGPGFVAEVHDLTIRNAGTAISNQAQLTLNRVTVTNTGNVNGAIINGGLGSLTINDSTINDNVGQWAITNGGGLTVTDSSVSDNDDRGIQNGDGDIAEITGSTISGNGDAAFENQGDLTVTDSTISGNNADPGGFGGGFTIFGPAPKTTLDHVTITTNTATGGGGIANSGSTSSELNITDSTIAGNDANSGGGIHNTGGPVTIERSTISGNSALSGEGGGISNGGTAVASLTNSTVSGNDATGQGGGIFNAGGATLNLSFSTVAGNTSTGSAGGIETGPILNLGNSIVANNTGNPNTRDDCFGPVTSQGYNLIENVTDPVGCPISGDTTGNILGMDPVLGGLAGNGGPTQTHELLSGSPAINAASPSCPSPGTDQRGVVRQPGRVCDIGAFEIAEEPVPPPPGDGQGDANPPNTQITGAPKDKTKKKTATFVFGADEPASFNCVLDGKQQFKACTSPLTVKVKKGKHSFSVTATDAAGNADPSPATDAWKVKRKKKKK